jgi:hypothetical protein
MDQCRNVLYLTATPATRSNNSYLLLLHLIDPTKYPQENESIALDNVIKLRGKVAEYRKLYQSDPQSVNSSKLRDELVRAGIVPENAVGKNRLSLTELVPISDFLFEHYRYSALVASNNQPTRFFKRRVEFTSSKTRFELLGELLSRDKSMSLDQIETYTKSLQSFRQMFKSVTGKDIDIKSRAQMELDETAKKDALCEYIINETTKNKHYSAVVFADSAPECSALSDYLLTKLPYLAVSSIYDCTEHCQILILDRENETGLSLTKYDEVIFYDIPMDVNRIDQRIGRLDRFGRNFLTPVVIMVPTYSYEYLKYEKTNSTEKSRAVTLKYADPFIDNILSLLHRGLGDISGRPLLHASDEVAKRKRFSIFDWSLNFVSHENEELLSNVLRLVQHSIEGEAYPMYKIEKSSKYADQTVIINSFLSIPSIKEYVRSWNDEANLGLQRITSESKIDQDSMSIANQLRIHQDWLKKISLFMVEWNESCPFNDYKFNTRIIGSNNLTELEEEIIRMLNIYDFN